jgi:glycosyltransferase involved in cell wall biosynthesis
MQKAKTEERMRRSCNSNSLHALIVVYKQSHADPRVVRELNFLIDRGYSIDLICVKPPSAPLKNEDNHLTLHAISISRKRGGIVRYLLEYVSFFLFASLHASMILLKKKINFVQVFTMPEPLVYTCILAKALRVKILMDWEDPTYELFLTKFKNLSSPPMRRILQAMERLSVAFVDHTITPNSAFKEAFVRRGHAAEKIDIVLNAPDTRVFKSEAARDYSFGKPFVVLFSGSILHRHGLDIGIRAFALLHKALPDVHLVIIGEGETGYTEECQQLIQKLQISDRVTWRGRVTINQMPGVYRDSSVVMIPNRRNSFTSINFPQRIFECGIMRRPAIVSRLPGIEAYMPEDSVRYVNPDDPVSLYEGLRELATNRERYQSLVERAAQVCRSISWEKEYEMAINRLTGLCIARPYCSGMASHTALPRYRKSKLSPILTGRNR